ncbi:MAG: nitroreductase family protein [Methanomicrobiales archaeon]|nr:nitroreductase family protein [Methanomicrobiales archaeon]
MNVGTTIIKSRRSVRNFKETRVPDEVVRDALECARQAPTAMNLQPWLVGVITDRDTLLKIADLTDHGKFIAKAPVCFAVFGERGPKYYLEDCAAFTMQLALGLWSYGVGSCWVAGDKKPYGDAVRTLLAVPESHMLVSLLPAGYPAEIAAPSKKELAKISFTNRYAVE